jgi:hypothetical protein
MSGQRSTGATRQVSREVGEPFNPWHKACGFYPPDVIALRRDLTDGQKRLYERAVRWAGQNGVLWRGFDSMAEALGKSVRQVKADMKILESMGFIAHRRRRRTSNVYEFLWHGSFEVRSAALQEEDLGVQASSLEMQDQVSLEVQSTAQESSQLESCPLNLAKADNKRISGYASQKPRSDASLLVPSPKTVKNQLPKADFNASSDDYHSSSSHSNSSRDWTERELAQVRNRIVAFWGREPEEGFEVSVMLRARGASAAEVCELLERKFANKKLRPGGRYAPKNQNWFLTVIENEFSPGHLPECPAEGHADEAEIDSAVLNRSTEAIELPDAPRSIVESVICTSCGCPALVVYTDGTVEGCGCGRNVSSSLKAVQSSLEAGQQLFTRGLSKRASA